MKRILSAVCCFLLLGSSALAQKPETFEGISYTVPKGWQKKVIPSATQMGIEDTKGVCLITILKPLPATADAKENFNTSWDTIVKKTVKLTGKLEMQPTSKEDGWAVESGVAPCEIEGKKGLVILMTMTGGRQMVNVLILASTDNYQTEIASFLESIHLPKLEATEAPASKSAPEKPTAAPVPRKSSFKFTTTNFDDGWTAVEQNDWVRITKGNIAVLVHYPNPRADAYNSELKAGLQNAWNLLVAPRYTNIRNFELKPIQSFESIAFAEADAEDRATGKSVHIVLFKKHFSKGNGKYIEFVTSSKRDFEQEFGAYHNDEFGWDKLVNMQAKNRFAVSREDLVGTWATSNTSTLSYYYADSGRPAGATATSTADAFTFSGAGSYKSDHAGASGAVGNQKFSRQVYQGKFAADKWTMTLTNRFQGQAETYDCYFEAVKGGRILMMVDKRKSSYALVKR